MATQPDRLVNIIKTGVSVKNWTRPGYAQNVMLYGDAWVTRPGFQQVAQLTADMPAPPLAGGEQFGIKRVMGHTSIVAPNGHKQVLTLVEADVCTANFYVNQQRITIALLVIYDLTSGRSWQEPLHRHMAQNLGDLPTPAHWRGQYQADQSQHFDQWQRAPVKPEAVWWCEVAGSVLFGCPSIGAWRYNPVDIVKPRSRDLATATYGAAAPWYSESAVVTPIAPAPGEFAAGFRYLDESTMVRPVDACNIDGRVAFADKRTIWFSDRGRPNCIRVTEFIEVSSPEPITAIAWRGDSLWIFTANERFVYVPSTTQGTLASGQLMKASNDDGCISCAAKVMVGNEVMWAGPTQIWQSTATTGVVKVGDPIDPLFVGGLANPLASYATAAGHTGLSAPQPRTWLNWLEVDGLHAVYNRHLRLTFFVLPQQNAALVWDGKMWVVWTFESMANSRADVSLSQNLPGAWLSSVVNELVLVAGPEYLLVDDQAVAGGDPSEELNENDKPGSLIVCRLGGPGFDRGVQDTEDNRQGPGYLAELLGGTSDTRVYIEKPFELEPGTVLPGGAVTQAGDLTYPIAIVLESGATLNHFDLEVRFDTVNWQPLTYAIAPTCLDVFWPAERMPSLSGWSPGSLANVGVSEATVAGNLLTFRWDGPLLPPGSWASHPVMNLQPDRRVLLYFTLRPKTANCTASAGWVGSACSFFDSTASLAKDPALFAWHHCRVTTKHVNNDVAQPVDWLLQSEHIEVQQVQVRLRGLWLKVSSRGRASTEIVPAWPLGLLNTVIGSDWKPWSSQIVDYDDGQQGKDISQQNAGDGLRSRMRAPTTWVLGKRTFNGTATWGDHTDATAGNFLVDDEEINEVVISDSVKGEYVLVTLFGFVRSASERIAIIEARAALLIEGARRRWGR